MFNPMLVFSSVLFTMGSVMAFGAILLQTRKKQNRPRDTIVSALRTRAFEYKYTNDVSGHTHWYFDENGEVTLPRLDRATRHSNIMILMASRIGLLRTFKILGTCEKCRARG